MLTIPEWIISGVLMAIAVFMVVIVLFQESDDDGLGGTIAGSSSAYDSYLGKNEGRTTNAKLARFTKIMATIFFVFVLVLDVLTVLD